jgi:hypothetical protein
LRISWFPYLGNAAPTAGRFSEPFDADWSSRWTVFGGNWLARDGSLGTVPASANGAKALAMATAFTNFTYEGDVSAGPDGNAGLVFRVTKPDIGPDAYCGYYVGINPHESRLEFGCASNAWHEIVSVLRPFAANQFYHLKISAQDSHIQIFLEHASQPAIDVRDEHFASGMIGVRDYCSDGDQSFSGFARLEAEEADGPDK